MAELADARDLKSRGSNFPYRFDPGHRHQTHLTANGEVLFAKEANDRRMGSTPVIGTKTQPTALSSGLLLKKKLSDRSPVSLSDQYLMEG